MIKFKNKKKIALVLSGGGLKAAAFHVGVCLALQEKGLKFIGGTKDAIEDSPHVDDPLAVKCYVGSSAGALLGAYLASGHKVEDIIESFQMGAGLLRRPLRRPKLKPPSYFDVFSLNSPGLAALFPKFWSRKNAIAGGLETILKNNFKVNGIFSARGAERYLRKHVLTTNSFSELGVEFYTVATQLDYSAKTVFCHLRSQTRDPEIQYANHAPISDAICASGSLPPIFAPYPIKDIDGTVRWYFDGEIRDTMSTHVASDNGADLIIGSNSIQPYHFNPEIGSLSEYGLPIIINQAVYHVVQQKIVRAIRARENERMLINAVVGYFREHNLPTEHAEKLVEIMSRKVNYRKEVDYIYIHPEPDNYEMFFVDHFSLNPDILSRIVKIGFKSAVNILRKYDI